jgi:hypothetical protein
MLAPVEDEGLAASACGLAPIDQRFLDAHRACKPAEPASQSGVKNTALRECNTRNTTVACDIRRPWP